MPLCCVVIRGKYAAGSVFCCVTFWLGMLFASIESVGNFDKS